MMRKALYTSHFSMFIAQSSVYTCRYSVAGSCHTFYIFSQYIHMKIWRRSSIYEEEQTGKNGYKSIQCTCSYMYDHVFCILVTSEFFFSLFVLSLKESSDKILSHLLTWWTPDCPVGQGLYIPSSKRPSLKTFARSEGRDPWHGDVKSQLSGHLIGTAA